MHLQSTEHVPSSAAKGILQMEALTAPMARDLPHNPEIRRTDDFEAIRALALRSGLEDGTFENVVSAFGYFLDNRLVGCVALKVEGTRYSVDWLAVEEGLRKMGLGSFLVSRVEAEARMRGADKLWTLARSPRFFEKIGFRNASMEEAGGPTLSNCLLCRQYQKTCFPAVLVKNL